MKNCDHIIGEWQGVDEGGSMRLSLWDTWNNHYVERFKFCPECGEEISHLQPKDRKEEESTHGPVTQAFIDETSKGFSDMMRGYINRSPVWTRILSGEKTISTGDDPAAPPSTAGPTS